MMHLTQAFLKIFFRNPRAIFFVIFLPGGLFVLMAVLGLEGILRYDLPVSYADYLLTGILAMALMQTGVYTAAYSLIEYKKNRVLKRLSVTPLSSSHFWLAQIFARFVIACLQAAVLLGLGVWLFETPLGSGLWVLPFWLLAGGTIFLGFGFLIAALARDYEEAAPYTAIIGLPLVFLGDVFFPAENLPRTLAQISDYLPLKPLSQILRHFVLGLPAQELGQQIGVVLLWLILVTVLSLYLFGQKVYK